MPDIVLGTAGNKTKSVSTWSLYSSKGSQTENIQNLSGGDKCFRGGKKQADDREFGGGGEEFGHAVIVTSQRVVRESVLQGAI